MERLEALQSSTAEAYKMAIRSVAQYAVELDPQDVAGFRERLEAIARHYEAAAADADMRRIQASFRGELRDYRDQTNTRIERLRQEVEAGAAAMAAFAGCVTSAGADHEAHLKNELDHLRDICGWNDLTEIRRGLQGVIAGIGEALEQMQRANRMAILQMQDEIRMLHRDMELKRRALITDAPTGAWNRQKSEERMQELLREKEAFRVILVSVKNFKRVQGRFSQRVIDGVLKALVKRLRGIAGDDAPIGRMDEGEFAVLLDSDPAGALTQWRDTSSSLSGAYSVQEAGFAVTVPLEVATGIVERAANMEADAFLKKLAQLSQALARG